MKTKNGLKVAEQVEIHQEPIPYPMLSLEQSRAILNQRGITYTDEEILIIREFMYRVVEITTQHYQRMQEDHSTLIAITKPNHDETKSVPLYPREHRRTG